MESSALLDDMDQRFGDAIDKYIIVLCVQVKKEDMKALMHHCEDKYITMELKDPRKVIPMKKVATSQFHDYYEA